MEDLFEKKKWFLEMSEPDFYDAMRKRDFAYMSDIYTEIMWYQYSCKDQYFFTEVLEGSMIRLPPVLKGVIQAVGKNFYYLLEEEDTIVYLLNKILSDEDAAYDYLKTTCMESDRVELDGNFIKFTDKAVKRLKLSVGDIMQITLYEDGSFIIFKLEYPVLFK